MEKGVELIGWRIFGPATTWVEIIGWLLVATLVALLLATPLIVARGHAFVRRARLNPSPPSGRPQKRSLRG